MKITPCRVVERPLELRAYRAIEFLTCKAIAPMLAVEKFRGYFDYRDGVWFSVNHRLGILAFV